ncbi:hTAFII28-like domain containing protein [Nitzschia inconspicua]|uniref:HTAFII28-like domain containing protein n=1 Tax=Nitzschia inconspicua TaxID=303405 RepID=A0A9K3M0W2_9STRA|nr:hTAFII28-like domain containing protein [Nitzschia inconspicua]
MGSNRKRLPGERPVSPSRDDKKKDGKSRKKKDKKKNKDGASSSDHHHQHKSSLETTATAEGQIMAQVLSTFSRLEQSRFEAFRRATFPRDAIAKFVAHCLIEEQHRPVSKGLPPATTKSNSVQPDDNKPLREPILSEVVAPGQAEDITIVVSTLAKAYAQRLVTAARRHAAARISAEANAEETAGAGPTNLFSTPNKYNEHGVVSIGKGSRPRPTQSSSAILPEDLMKAFEERKAQGLDPGFFLQPWTESQSVLVDNDIYQQKRLAALHAQEQYDKLHGGPQPDEEKDKGDGGEKGHDEIGAMESGNPDTDHDFVVPMETSSPN